MNHNALPAFKMSVILCAGILMGKQCVASWAGPGLFAALLGFLSLCLLFLLRRRGIPAGLLTLFASLLCFLGGAAKISSDRLKTDRPPDSLLQQATVIGWAREDASSVNGRGRLVLQAEAFLDGRTPPHVFRANILATLIRSREDSVFPFPHYGVRMALHGSLAPPSAERNPGEFSPLEYYEANGVSLLMTVRGAKHVSIMDCAAGSWVMREAIVPLRRWMLMLIDSTVGGEEGEFLQGLMIGDRNGLSQATREAFVNSGVAHILAVSGSNVAVVAGILMLLFEMMRIPRRLRTMAVLAGLYAYMLLTGSQPPVVRATIMASVFLLSRLFQRRSNPYNGMGVAAFLILGMDARQMFDVGFQLSFGAVLSIIHFYPILNGWISRLPSAHPLQRGLLWLLRVCAVSVAATLGTLPLTAVSFGRVSIIGLAANIVVIPAAELSVVLGFASTFASCVSGWLAESYAALNQVILHWTLVLTRLAGNASFAYIDTTTFAPIDSIPFYSGLLLLFHHKGRSAVRGLIALMVALNIAVFGPRGQATMRPPGVMRVSFIDVGQGDAILAELPEGKTVLLDAGPRTPLFDAGEKIVTPFLKRRGIRTIDLFVISHGHSDHAGGAPSILKNFDVRKVTALEGLPAGVRAFRGVEGSETQWPDSVRAGMSLLEPASARVYALYPFPAPSSLQVDTTSENRCIIMKLQYGRVSFMFTGDADGTAERELTERYGSWLRSTVLKAGHHGSRTSSTQCFLDAVHPEVVVISVGRNNRFRHPSGVVVQRITERCGPPLRTDEEGAIIFDTDGMSLSRLAWR